MKDLTNTMTPTTKAELENATNNVAIMTRLTVAAGLPPRKACAEMSEKATCVFTDLKKMI
jgi:hypothetical protein